MDLLQRIASGESSFPFEGGREDEDEYLADFWVLAEHLRSLERRGWITLREGPPSERESAPCNDTVLVAELTIEGRQALSFWTS